MKIPNYRFHGPLLRNYLTDSGIRIGTSLARATAMTTALSSSRYSQRRLRTQRLTQGIPPQSLENDAFVHREFRSIVGAIHFALG